MTFPGESLTVADSGNVTGTPIASATDVAYRAGSATFTAGDEAWVDVSLYPMLLTAGEPDVEVRWVVEVLSGSGTLTLTEDAGPLGSHTVTAGTLVVPSTLTGDDIVAGGMARLTIACTSGTVVVQQVKLRAWPVGGPLGGLSDPYTPPAEPVPLTMHSVAPSAYEMAEYITGTSLAQVFEDTEQHLAGTLGGFTVGDPVYSPSADSGGAATFNVNADYTGGAIPPARGSGGIGAAVSYIQRPSAATVPDPEGVFGVDWIYPPNEVPSDPDGWQWAGPSEWGWYQGVATVSVVYDVDGETPGNFRIGADPRDAFDPPATLFSDIFTSANVVAAIKATPILPDLEFDLPPMSDAGMLRLVIWHDGATPPPFQPATQGDQVTFKSTGDAYANLYLGKYIGSTYYPVRASHTRPYRYWTPTGAPKPIPLRLIRRGDGLGMGSGRVLSTGTRQRSTRVFGVL